MKPVYRSNVYMLAILVWQLIGSLLLGKYLRRVFPENQLLVVTQVLFLLIPIIIYFALTGLPVKRTLKLNPLSLEDAVMIIIIAFLSMPIASFLSQVGSLFFKNIVSEVMNEISNTPLLMQLGIVALVPAMCEEMTMRGIVLSGYEKIGRGKAAVVTGLFFGILHMNPQQFLYPFALGILFAYLVRITNSIFSTMLCHFVFNGTQVTLSYLALRANPNALQSASNSLATMSFQDKIISLLQLLLWSLICIWIIVIILKKMDKRHNIVSTSQIDIDKNNTESNEEIEYLLKDIREEKVVNLPFILVICVYIIFTLLGLYYFKKF